MTKASLLCSKTDTISHLQHLINKFYNKNVHSIFRWYVCKREGVVDVGDGPSVRRKPHLQAETEHTIHIKMQWAILWKYCSWADISFRNVIQHWTFLSFISFPKIHSMCLQNHSMQEILSVHTGAHWNCKQGTCRHIFDPKCSMVTVNKVTNPKELLLQCV